MQETKLKLLERIVDRRQDSLYRFAYFRTGSQADAEDIVQDVLLRLFHSDCNLDRIDDVERYLWWAIANRCCSPPDNWNGILYSLFCRLTMSSTSAILLRICNSFFHPVAFSTKCRF